MQKEWVTILGLDEIDNKILSLIRYDARLTYSEIGEELKLSRVTIKKRMESMIERGIIKGFETIIDETRIHDDSIEFVLDIEAVPERYEELVDDLAKEKYLRKIVVVSGRCRLQAFGIAPNTKKLSEYVDSLYYRMRGIKSISWNMVLSTLMDKDGGVDYDEQRNKRREEGGLSQT